MFKNLTKTENRPLSLEILVNSMVIWDKDTYRNLEVTKAENGFVYGVDTAYLNGMYGEVFS